MKSATMKAPGPREEPGKSSLNTSTLRARLAVVNAVDFDEWLLAFAARFRWRPPAADLERERELTGEWWSDLHPRAKRRGEQ